ncbi:FAD-binding 9, siderophore-interacting domain-containing protein [Ahrensia marina]|uniref:FAD-binding 9, siderophore-interacting domain-containing protein n=2 Tax=Ahrensia marina TaxID=1514904 RepID=A0A0N0E6X5_9HYPH|nr:FAD-binding 9, siderophore-interacting domain-containing protein [Ahrensia marina]
MENRPSRRLLTVERAQYITPNMIRITFAGDELNGIATDRAGGNCKILLPDEGQSREDFAQQLEDGPKPVIRTYTVRSFRENPLEMDVDFVAHGDSGPAARWASRAKPGDFCGFAGPSLPKLTKFYADYYLIAADMTALPVACATLEAMPDDAKGIAVFEILSEADKQPIKAPAGIEIHWLVSPDPHLPSPLQEDFIRSLSLPNGTIQTCIAGESSVIRALRIYLVNEKQIPKEDAYISGYWKIGLIEDEHQIEKRNE